LCPLEAFLLFYDHGRPVTDDARKTSVKRYLWWIAIVVVGCWIAWILWTGRWRVGSVLNNFPSDGRQTTVVSIVQLLADPQRYDNKRVYVGGYVVLAFEDHSLYLDRESYAHVLGMNSLGLVHGFEGSQWAANGRHCMIEGVFRALPSNSVALRSGYIEQISKITILPARCWPPIAVASGMSTTSSVVREPDWEPRGQRGAAGSRLDKRQMN
jgi:hypothetical protein